MRLFACLYTCRSTDIADMRSIVERDAAAVERGSGRLDGADHVHERAGVSARHCAHVYGLPEVWSRDDIHRSVRDDRDLDLARSAATGRQQIHRHGKDVDELVICASDSGQQNSHGAGDQSADEHNGCVDAYRPR
jgi:hypothetical protein